MSAIVIDQPVRKAFTLHADPLAADQQPYVAIAAESRADRSIYVGVTLGGETREMYLERADVDPAALRDRWNALNSIRLSVIETRETRWRPRIMLRDGALPVAHIDWDGRTEKSRRQSHEEVVRQTARYLKSTLNEQGPSPFPFFEPYVHYFTSDLKPRPLIMAAMRFFDGSVREIVLEEDSGPVWDHQKAIGRWQDIMAAFEPRLIDPDGKPQVVVLDRAKNVVQAVPYDNATADTRKNSQCRVMGALYEIYHLHKAARPSGFAVS